VPRTTTRRCVRRDHRCDHGERSERGTGLGAIGNKNASEGTALTFTATATDADLPANTSPSPDRAPAGATINGSTGEFTDPGESDGGTAPSFKVRVTDNGTGALFDEEQITVTVAEVNSAPVVDAIPDKEVNEETALTFTAHATDPAFRPIRLPGRCRNGSGRRNDQLGSTGAFSWTPTEAWVPASTTSRCAPPITARPPSWRGDRQSR
jgi:hypothetical protein